MPRIEGLDCFNFDQGWADMDLSLRHLPIGIRKIALAPVISEKCFLSYIEQAKSDNASTLIFFCDSMCSNPPYDLTLSWELPFSVLAIRENTGVTILNQMASVNSRDNYPLDSPVSHKIYRVGTEMHYHPKMNLKSSAVPLIVLGAFVIFLCVLFFLAHLAVFVQRVGLERRVLDGEINIEEVGGKRLKVPKHILEKIPAQNYTRELGKLSFQVLENDKQEEVGNDSDVDHRSENDNNSSADICQSQCVICLDDFIPDSSRVRILPCKHMFHPGCIDKYLLVRSSLCPLCKSSCLPRGYLPPGVKITYGTMYRAQDRERGIRRRRSVDDIESPPTNSPDAEVRCSLWRALFILPFHRRDNDSNNNNIEPLEDSGLEMDQIGEAEHYNTEEYHDNDFLQNNGDDTTIPLQEEEEEQFRRLPLQKRILKTLFPMF